MAILKLCNKMKQRETFLAKENKAQNLRQKDEKPPLSLQRCFGSVI